MRMNGVLDTDGFWLVPLDYIEGWNEMTDNEKRAHVQGERDIAALCCKVPSAECVECCC